MFNRQTLKFWLTCVASIIGVTWFFQTGGTWTFFLVSWLISSVITKIANVAYHRWIAHGMFKPNKLGQFVLLWSCVTSCLTPPVRYAIGHRLHHLYPDSDLDPHTPKIGFFNCLLGNFNTTGGLAPVKDILRQRPIMFVDRYYYWLFALNWLIMFVISPQFAMLSFALINLRTWVNITVFNYVAHGGSEASGPRNMSTLSCYALGHLGEQLHKNHHDQPRNVNFGRQSLLNRDVVYFLIRPFIK